MKKGKPRNKTGKGGRKFTPEIAKEMAKKSAAARKERRQRLETLRDWALIYRDLPSDDKDVSMGEAAIKAVYARAINEGDVRATQFLADLMGETENRITLKEIPKLLDDV